jgi:hypothetical protein
MPGLSETVPAASQFRLSPDHRLNTLETEIFWQPAILPTSRMLRQVLRDAKIWYRRIGLSCRYSIFASLWSVKLNRILALALFAPPMGRGAALIL